MVKYLLLIALLLCVTSPMVFGEPVSKRSQALQFYQEGLFQETGTGDLKMAASIYETILKDYSQFRDIQAVALYHLGLINVKLGKNEAALQFFLKIKKNYKDQKTVYKQAVIKSKHIKSLLIKLEREKAEASSKQVIQKEFIEKPKSTSSSMTHFGMGINNIGLHLRLPLATFLALEPRIQYQPWDQRFHASIRGLYFLHSKQPVSTTHPYFGFEGGTLSRQSEKWDYKIGSFVGYEWTPTTSFGLNCDLGYYYQNNPDGQNNAIETQILFNTGATLYF